MPHFLIKKEEIKNDIIELIDNENLFHLTKVLRIKPHQKVKFIDEDRNLYSCEVIESKKDFLCAKILEKNFSNRILKNNLVLVQSILATDAQNLLIANATQTGVKKIYPVMSDNVCVSLASLKGKVEKWQKIANENFKQCERADLASVEEISNFKTTLSQFKKENILIFAEKYENSDLNNCLSDIDLNSEIAIIIGPEGGFSEAEFDYFKEQNYKLITLGKMIYKAPNAVVSAISNVVSRIE